MIVRKVLVFHTAFIGDIVLTLPLVQGLHTAQPEAVITFVAIPTAAGVLANHPAVNNIMVYDKRDRDSGISGILALASRLRREQFDAAIIPHRSLRSAVIPWLARIPRRVGFSTSAAAWLFTDVVPYEKESHEIDRNVSLLKPLLEDLPEQREPMIYPDREDILKVDELFAQSRKSRLHQTSLIGFAPGSVWNTKRWLKEHFVELGRALLHDGHAVALIGGEQDEVLSKEIEDAIGEDGVINAVGRFSLLQSAELIRRCVVLVSNDSAPMHLAAGVRTPVVAIFGATAPRFGFAPRGRYDAVAEIDGLSCRPCAIHGGDRCPIGTFVCMKDLTPQMVYSKVRSVIQSLKLEAQ